MTAVAIGAIDISSGRGSGRGLRGADRGAGARRLGVRVVVAAPAPGHHRGHTAASRGRDLMSTRSAGQ